MNWACIGFLIAGVLFLIYAATFYSLAEKKLPAFLKEYAYAYFSLGAAFLLWAYAALNNNFLSTSVLIGDGLIFLASLFLIAILFHKKWKTALLVIGFIAFALCVYGRMYYFVPTPFMYEGILIFNTPQIFVWILGAIFVFIWLPANMLVGREVTARMSDPRMSFVYTFIYSLTTVSGVLLISSHTVFMVTMSFIVLGLCFIMLLASNYVIQRSVSTLYNKDGVPQKSAYDTGRSN